MHESRAIIRSDLKNVFSSRDGEIQKLLETSISQLNVSSIQFVTLREFLDERQPIEAKVAISFDMRLVGLPYSLNFGVEAADRSQVIASRDAGARGDAAQGENQTGCASTHHAA